MVRFVSAKKEMSESMNATVMLNASNLEFHASVWLENGVEGVCMQFYPTNEQHYCFYISQKEAEYLRNICQLALDAGKRARTAKKDRAVAARKKT